MSGLHVGSKITGVLAGKAPLEISGSSKAPPLNADLAGFTAGMSAELQGRVAGMAFADAGMPSKSIDMPSTEIATDLEISPNLTNSDLGLG